MNEDQRSTLIDVYMTKRINEMSTKEIIEAYAEAYAEDLADWLSTWSDDELEGLK